MKRIQRTSAPQVRMLVVAIGLVGSLALPGWCQIPGKVIKKNNKGEVVGAIKFKQSTREYVVTANGVTMTIPVGDVEEARAAKEPAELATAIQQVQSGQAVLAIAKLETIVKDYAGFRAVEGKAAKALAEAYIKTDPGKAVAMCEKVISANPQIANVPDFAAIYWRALLDLPNAGFKLKSALDNAIATGPRSLVAQALVARGDMEKKQGSAKVNLENALVDGYLRVVVLYKDVKEVHPAALYNSIKCFELLNQGAYADRLRKILLAEYPDDPYSEKIKSGS